MRVSPEASRRHALRLAAVIALVNSNTGKLDNIPADAFTCGMRLADYYASEALRLWDNATTHPDIKSAKRLLTWLHERGDDTIDLPTIYQKGPRAAQARDKASALRVVGVLAGHGWLAALPDRKSTWRVRPPQ